MSVSSGDCSRLLRDDFGYRPQLTVQQLLSDRFAQEKKIQFVIDISPTARQTCYVRPAATIGAAQGEAGAVSGSIGIWILRKLLSARGVCST